MTSAHEIRSQKISSSKAKKIAGGTVASMKKKTRIGRFSEYASSDEEDVVDEDNSEVEDDENFVSKSKSVEVNGTHTRASSRPARSAAIKANKNLSTRKQGTDYHQQPELLYEQQVHRYHLYYCCY